MARLGFAAGLWVLLIVLAVLISPSLQPQLKLQFQSWQGAEAGAVLADQQEVQAAQVSAIDEKIEQALERVDSEVSAMISKKVSAAIDTILDRTLESIVAASFNDLGARMDSKIEAAVNSLSSTADVDASGQVNRRKAEVKPGKDKVGQLRVRRSDVKSDHSKSGVRVAKPSDHGTKQVGDRSNTSACRGQDVTAAPKDWCGTPARKSCLDSWEVKYMSDNADKLSKGLRAIRSAGCFPLGVSIAAMGYYRTGSTLLYNVVRLWAALGAGESLVAGWMCKDPKKMSIGDLGTPQEKCSSVCKDHTWHTGNAEHTSIIVMSRRDPFSSVCSRKLMEQWCKIQVPKGGKSPSREESNVYARRCKKDPVMERNETIRQCHELMKMQASIYYGREQAGKSIAYDVLMEDYEQNPAGEVRAVARGLGICKEAVNNAQLVQFVVEMGAQLKSNPSADMGITQMHDVHTPEQRKQRCSRLEEWMRSDDECRDWMDAKASVTANAELEKMRLNSPKQRMAKELSGKGTHPL